MLTRREQHFKAAVAVCVHICSCLYVRVYFVMNGRIIRFRLFHKLKKYSNNGAVTKLRLSLTIMHLHQSK